MHCRVVKCNFLREVIAANFTNHLNLLWCYAQFKCLFYSSSRILVFGALYDTYLSYLLKDEKIQNVLGHFQKDFEGVVSAENLGKSRKRKTASFFQKLEGHINLEVLLNRWSENYLIVTGAKFGGYGSFLPAHQPSPVWSHPGSPPKVQNYSTTRSPNNCLLGVHF
jgi:hypothetical protein